MAYPSLTSQVARRGLMLVLSSPSGAGKTTISRRLMERDQNLSLSISVTTRPKRPGEVAGQDYIFVDKEEFNLMINRQEFLEYAKVFGHYYGTPLGPVMDDLSKGHDVMFDIDWQGTQQLAQKAREDLVSVFVLPPSMQELERRLLGRAQDDAETVNYRMSKAADELSHWAEYDYILINHDIEESVSAVLNILNSERLKRQRQLGLPEFVKSLMEGI